MTLRAALKQAENRLRSAGVPDARHDSRALLSFVIGQDAVSMMLSGGALSEKQADAFFELIERRAARTPLQYLTGEACFMGLTLKVNEGVLIPRFDTESVCEAALDGLPRGARVLDLCTGSGALAVAVKKLRPDCDVTATDLSAAALSVARENAERNGAAVAFLLGDLWAGAEGPFDLVVSNPPYIPTAELDTLQEEVRREPALALDGGADGFTVYRRIVAEAPRYLKESGRLVLEAGDGQADRLLSLCRQHFDEAEVRRDLSGGERAVIAQKPRKIRQGGTT